MRKEIVLIIALAILTKFCQSLRIFMTTIASKNQINSDTTTNNMSDGSLPTNPSFAATAGACAANCDSTKSPGNTKTSYIALPTCRRVVVESVIMLSNRHYDSARNAEP
jgi:hypothetical protein